jgi:hypothetical protein
LRKKATNCRFDSITRNADGSISTKKAYTIAQNGIGNTKVAKNKKNRLEGKITLNSEVCEGRVVLDLPIRTVSEANCFEHWTKSHARHKAQKQMVSIFLGPLKDKIKLPCKIMLTRFAPDELDTFENLPMSFKYIVDAVCAVITGDYRPGRADGDKRISLACNQIKNKDYGIRIEINF